MTVDEFMAKVETRLEQTNGTKPSFEAVEDAACWYICVRDAQYVYDLTIKEVARIIRDGDVLGGPYRTLADIQCWVENQDEETWIDIDEKLDLHFGIKPLLGGDPPVYGPNHDKERS
jgi:hypothetical protein